MNDKNDQSPESSEEEVAVPDTVRDIQLNLNFRYTRYKFLVKVYPKYCMGYNYIEKYPLFI